MAIQSMTNNHEPTSFWNVIWSGFALLFGLFWSFIWFGLTLFFGLFQIFLVWLISLLFPATPFSIEQICSDGGLLFFSMALISSLMIDYFLFRKAAQNFLQKLLFTFFPIVLFSICSVVFVMCHLQTQLKTPINTEITMIIQLFILFFTAIYAVLIKQTSFK